MTDQSELAVFCQETFPTILSREFFNLFAGNQIGHGISRRVFAGEVDQSVVIKIEHAPGSFQNMMEWEVWEAVKPSRKISSWFAPCVAISPCGQVLVQKRCVPLRADDRVPDRVPTFFTDLKLENWGLLDGRLVCLDYGCNLSIVNSITTKTKKAHWS